MTPEALYFLKSIFPVAKHEYRLSLSDGVIGASYFLHMFSYLKYSTTNRKCQQIEK